MQKTIYLDQNMWIYLSRCYYGLEKNPIHNKINDKILDVSKKESCLFPLSIIHFEETLKRNELKSRDRLVKYMAAVSKGYFIYPFSSLMVPEIQNAINKRVGRPINKFEKSVIGKGFTYMLGSKCVVKGDHQIILTKEIVDKICTPPTCIPPSYMKKLYESVGKPISFNEIIDGMLASPDVYNIISQGFIKPLNNSYVKKNEVIKVIESIRNNERVTFKDKRFRYRVSLIRNFSKIVIPIVSKISIESGLSKDAIFKKNWTEKDYLEFMQEIPSFYILFQLSYKSERDYNKPITNNDLNDIYALTMAIAYCDIVVCDRRFAQIAKAANLDTIYNTKILKSLDELNQII